MKVMERLIARHALTNTIGDKLFHGKATRQEEAKADAASLRDIRLTWRRNTQIQMNWLWKWWDHSAIASFHDERTNVYWICYFGSLTFFKHFKIMVGEALPPLPALTAPHWIAGQSKPWFGKHASKFSKKAIAKRVQQKNNICLIKY